MCISCLIWTVLFICLVYSVWPSSLRWLKDSILRYGWFARFRLCYGLGRTYWFSCLIELICCGWFDWYVSLGSMRALRLISTFRWYGWFYFFCCIWFIYLLVRVDFIELADCVFCYFDKALCWSRRWFGWVDWCGAYTWFHLCRLFDLFD